MTTNVSVTGTSGSTEEIKCIELTSYINSDGKFIRTGMRVHDWGNIQLLATRRDFDLMYAWDDKAPQEGYVYQGKWNDGVV